MRRKACEKDNTDISFNVKKKMRLFVLLGEKGGGNGRADAHPKNRIAENYLDNSFRRALFLSRSVLAPAT
jgi:hypothetical protein